MSTLRQWLAGPTNRQSNIWVDGERTINWFPEIINAGTPKVSVALRPTPGVDLFAFLPNGPIRAVFYQDGRMFAVSGASFFEVYNSGDVTNYGGVRLDGRPATISSNGAAGHQLFITSGGLGYIFDLLTNTLTRITDDGFPTYVVVGMFFDGYFIALNGITGAIHLSALEDGLTWDATDVAQESQFSDKILAIVRTHDNLWMFGSKNTAPWVNAGSGNYSFVPVQGSIIEHGVDAVFSVMAIDNTVMWVGRDEHGGRVVWKASGYTPVKVSTVAVDAVLARASNIDRAVAYGYQEEGHLFYVLYVPFLETTWVYDISTDLWHERGHWDVRYERFMPHLGINHCYGFRRHLVGDRQSGAIYEMSMGIVQDHLVVP